MPKGYWVVNNVVRDSEVYEEYKRANAEPFRKFGARFLVRGGSQKAAEGEALPRTVVLEFPSYEQALACYESPEYQKAKAIREPVSDGQLVIVEGYDG